MHILGRCFNDTAVSRLVDLQNERHLHHAAVSAPWMLQSTAAAGAKIIFTRLIEAIGFHIAIVLSNRETKCLDTATFVHPTPPSPVTKHPPPTSLTYAAPT